MKKAIKRGFTLVELLVVIAILAILATVSIVGYTKFIEKANKSADEQAVVQMNKVLLADGILANPPVSVDDVKAVLTENGYNGKFETSYAGYTFGWLVEENAVVLVDFNNETIVFPEEYKNESTEGENFQYFNVTVATDAASLNEQIEAFQKGDAKFSKIVLSADVNLPSEQPITVDEGSKVEIDLNGKKLTGTADAIHVYGTGNLELKNGTIDIAGDAVHVKGTGQILLENMTIKTSGNYGIVTNGGKSLDSLIVIDGCTVEASYALFIPAGTVAITNSSFVGRSMICGGNVTIDKCKFIGTGSGIADKYLEAEGDTDPNITPETYLKGDGDEGCVTFGDALLVVVNRGATSYIIEKLEISNTEFKFKDGVDDEKKAYGLRIYDLKNANSNVNVDEVIKLTNNTYVNYDGTTDVVKQSK